MSIQTNASTAHFSGDDLNHQPMVSASKRVLYTALGIMFVAIGLLGVLLPGVPTTGPLIAASFFLARSNPRLAQRLLGQRVFRNYLQYLDGSTPMPMRARIWALACMWTSILVSCILIGRGRLDCLMLIYGILFMGLIGTAFIIACYRPACRANRSSRVLSVRGARARYRSTVLK